MIEEQDFINNDTLGKNLAVPKKKNTLRKDDLPLVLSALKGLSVDVQEILANQRSILLRLGQRETATKTLFTEKYKLEISFQSTEQFDEFNEKLKIDDGLRTEFSSSLNWLFDRELNASKTLTNVFKKYLSQNVILKFTAKKNVPGKRIMKGTYFYECISGVIIPTHGRPGEKPLTEYNICSLICKVFNNAKNWEGERQKRAALQNRLSDKAVRGRPRNFMIQRKIKIQSTHFKIERRKQTAKMSLSY
ncbi:uncharacterized protein LOC117178645 [Belonocnema kinseyi]|uniref:uncharacterized protein LOC117178645 n=1 Tax=Belonocnema kinseyi TaxID=2817044 RepID=UPI00143DADB7|nr:uncharacterized protein LOC117178645 [Belonocnema kinseyi]